MPHSDEGLRLRIFIHESLRHGHTSLYKHVVEMARDEGLAGVTVFRAIEGYGVHRHIHTTRLVDASDNLPMIVEIVDVPYRVRDFVTKLDGIIPHGTAAISPVRVIKYRSGAMS